MPELSQTEFEDLERAFEVEVRKACASSQQRTALGCLLALLPIFLVLCVIRGVFSTTGAAALLLVLLVLFFPLSYDLKTDNPFPSLAAILASQDVRFLPVLAQKLPEYPPGAAAVETRPVFVKMLPLLGSAPWGTVSDSERELVMDTAGRVLSSGTSSWLERQELYAARETFAHLCELYLHVEALPVLRQMQERQVSTVAQVRAHKAILSAIAALEAEQARVGALARKEKEVSTLLRPADRPEDNNLLRPVMNPPHDLLMPVASPPTEQLLRPVEEPDETNPPLES